MAEGDTGFRLYVNHGWHFPLATGSAETRLVFNVGSTLADVYYEIPARGWGSVIQEEVAAQPPVPSPQFRLYIEITA
jgi:hypothetical protein